MRNFLRILPCPYTYTPYSPILGAIPQAPAQQRPGKKRNGLVVGLIIALAIIFVSSGYVALVAFVSRSAQLPLEVQATATPTITAVLLDQDSLTNGEDISWDKSKFCFLAPDGYHVIARACLSPGADQYDFDVAVQAKQIHGPTTNGYGLDFRIYGYDQFYTLAITSEGSWDVVRCDEPNSSNNSELICSLVVQPTVNPAINTGLKVNNIWRVRGQGAQFTSFVNDTIVGTANDPFYGSGRFGVEADTGVECVFTNFVAYALT